MAWTDRLRPASFRGVPFQVDAASSTYGRRLVTHEYALRDKPFVEDMGRKTRAFEVTGFVIGDDYFDVRDALIGAAETRGVGELVHPYYGTLQVFCESLSVTENKEPGRMATLSFSFVEQGDTLFPTVLVDTQGLAKDAANLVNTEAATDYANAFQVAEVQDFALTDSLDAIGTEIQTLQTEFDKVSDQIDNAEEIKRQIDGLFASLVPLINTPSEFANTLIDGLADIDVRPLFIQLAKAVQLPAFIEGAVSSNDIAQNNTRATLQLWRRSILAYAAIASAEEDWTVIDDAQAALNELADLLIAEESEDGTPTRVYRALVDLRVSVSDDITERANATATALVEWTPPTVTSTLETAQLFYSNGGGRNLEIEERNAPPHPGFLSPSETLSLLIE